MFAIAMLFFGCRALLYDFGLRVLGAILVLSCLVALVSLLSGGTGYIAFAWSIVVLGVMFLLWMVVTVLSAWNTRI